MIDVWGETYFLRIVIPILCGFIVGAERQLKGKPVGVRTSILICLGTMSYMYLAQQIQADKDVTRVLGQIVTGIGFLGAGVIMNKEGLVTGLTSAAVIWVLASIGAAIGLGYYVWAIALAILVVVILTGVEKLEELMVNFQKGSYHHAKKGKSHKYQKEQ